MWAKRIRILKLSLFFKFKAQLENSQSNLDSESANESNVSEVS